MTAGVFVCLVLSAGRNSPGAGRRGSFVVVVVVVVVVVSAGICSAALTLQATIKRSWRQAVVVLLSSGAPNTRLCRPIKWKCVSTSCHWRRVAAWRPPSQRAGCTCQVALEQRKTVVYLQPAATQNNNQFGKWIVFIAGAGRSFNSKIILTCWPQSSADGRQPAKEAPGRPVVWRGAAHTGWPAKQTIWQLNDIH